MSKPSNKTIATAIDQLISGKLPAAQAAEIVAAYLVSERRTKELDGLMRKVLELRAARGVYEAQITSAYELSDKTRQDLAGIVRAAHANSKRVIMHDKRDKSVIGGVLLESSDTVLDLTVRDRLQYLSQLITNTT